MATIESRMTNAMNVHLGSFQSVTLVPGYNIGIPDDAAQGVLNHPSIQQHIAKGLIVVTDFNKIPVLDPSGLAVVQEKNEVVPVSAPNTSGGQKPVLDSGRRFTMEDLNKANISNALAQTIVRLTPSEGWVSKAQLVSNLELSEKNAELINPLFE